MGDWNGPHLLQVGSLVVIDIGSALLVGGSAVWAIDPAKGSSRTPIAVGTVLALIGNIAFFWWQAATMADVPLAEAPRQLMPVLEHSRFGTLWIVQMAALLCCVALGRPFAERHGLRLALLLGSVLVFIGARAATSHAGASGDLAGTLADAVHLLGATLWAGLVFCISFGLPWHSSTAAEARRCKRFLHALSLLATTALALIVLTGLWASYRSLGIAAAPWATDYGRLLVVKIGLAGAAAALGGVNRWLYMPRLLTGLDRPSLDVQAASRSFGRVLKIEAAVLLCVLVLAALLATTAPTTVT